MPEQILTFKPGETAKLIGEGKMTVVSRPSIVESTMPVDSRAERAKQLFGEDFFGEEAIRIMEEKCKAKGINVQFKIPQIPFHLDEDQLESAKQEENQGRARMVVLRPESMVVNGEEKPITILNLRDLFKNEVTDPDSNETTITYDNNPFGEGPVFWDQDWFDEEEFAKEPIKPGFALPTNEVIPDSLNKTWDEQEALLLPGERRREAIEAVWDTLLHYSATGEKVLRINWDWTNGRTSDGYAVYVRFDSDGLYVYAWSPGRPAPRLGVCSSR